MGDLSRLEYIKTDYYIKERFETPKISVIIPVYNIGNYPIPCFDRLICQTLKELEFICINNNSTDNSIKTLETYAKNDARFIIISQENQSQEIARNKGLEIAKGKYIIFVDSDDLLEADTLEKIYKYRHFKKTITINYKEYSKKLELKKKTQCKGLFQ
jgi:glycosyltransferase involved in cell wall biosynthesis